MRLHEADLAIHGGPKTRTSPTAPWPRFLPEDIAAATSVLESGKVNYWTGDEGRAFEREYAAAVGLPHAIALANGTVSLELALRVLGVGHGDEVVVPSRTFIATASAVVAVGARPVVADVDRDSGNVTAETIRAAASARTRAVIPVHLGGWPCEMDAITDLASERGFAVIEDCAQAHGATHRGKPVGSFGVINSFSFCQDKIITTGGEGGLLTLRDEATWKRAWAYKDHGKSFDAVYHHEHPPGFRWLHESWGTNWRMTEMQAAIGRAQLRRLPVWHARRRDNARALLKRLAESPSLRVPDVPAHAEHAWYRVYAYLRPETLREGWTRDRVAQAIAAEGVPCFSGSCSEIYREKAFATTADAPRERLPVARELGETSLAFLCHPTLDATDMEDTAEAVAKVLRVAGK